MADFKPFAEPLKITLADSFVNGEPFQRTYWVYAVKSEQTTIPETILEQTAQDQSRPETRNVDIPGYRLTYKIHYSPAAFQGALQDVKKADFVKKVLLTKQTAIALGYPQELPQSYVDDFVLKPGNTTLSSGDIAYYVEAVDQDTIKYQKNPPPDTRRNIQYSGFLPEPDLPEETGEMTNARAQQIADLTLTLTVDAVHPPSIFENAAVLPENYEYMPVKSGFLFQQTLLEIGLQAAGLSRNGVRESPTHRRDMLSFLSLHFPRIPFSQQPDLGDDFAPVHHDIDNNRLFIPSFYLHGMSSEQEFREYVEKYYYTKNIDDQPQVAEFVEGRETPQEKAAREKQEQEDFRRYVRDIKVTEQALLLNNLKYFSDLSIDIRKERPYNNFACIDAKEPKGTNDSNNNISDFVTMLTAQRGMTPIIDQLRPIHLSSMIPVVRFYGYENDEKDDLFEYEFEEFLNINDGRSNDILGTSKGVGLVSFSWNLHGENYYLADKEIKCQMVIRAQSVDDLVHQRSSANGKDYKFSQIFIPVDTTDQQGTTGGTDVKARVMRTRAKIAYKIDESSPVWAGYDELRSAIKRMTFELELALSMHSIDLNQDGTMRITVDFVGRFDEESKDYRHANILSEDYIEEVKKGKTERLKALRTRSKELETKREEIQSNSTFGTYDTVPGPSTSPSEEDTREEGARRRPPGRA